MAAEIGGVSISASTGCSQSSCFLPRHFFSTQVLQQIALQQLPLGIATTVLSTAPVMALLVARAEQDRLGWQGLMASLLAVSGVALAVLS